MIKLDANVGIFSDIHIGLGQDSQIWHKNILQFANWTVEVYKNKNISQILIPGDVFHNRNEISVNTISMASDFFNIFLKNNFEIFISTGNHDCYYKDRSDVNSISLLRGWSNITLVDTEPVIFGIKKSDRKVVMVPWGTNIENIPLSDICLGHFEIESFKMNTYKTCEHGIKSENLLSKSPFIISGHFHRRAFRPYNNGSILYLGSPYQQNFGDIDDSRGIYTMNLLNNEFEFIENTISPKHIKVFLSHILSKKINSKKLKEIIPNNMVSLVIDANILPEEINLISDKLHNLNPNFFRIEYKVSEETISSNNVSENFDSVDILNNLKDFIKAIDINFKEETFSYLEELYLKLT